MPSRGLQICRKSGELAMRARATAGEVGPDEAGVVGFTKSEGSMSRKERAACMDWDC